MKFLSILLVILGVSVISEAKSLIRVAVIDTGIVDKYKSQSHLCESGHKDFTGEGLTDIHGHGTNVVGLIVKNADISGYCIIIIKAYGFKNEKTSFLTEALRYAYDLNVDVINVSGGGVGFQFYEYLIVKKILNKKISLFVAAGNDGVNLDKNCNYYPACYDNRVYVIGNESSTSNKGKIVDLKVNGTNKEAFGYTQSGTSQSTAIVTGQTLKLALTAKKK